jgi:hypothetical protein
MSELCIKPQSVPRSKRTLSYKNQSMLYREIIAVCSQVHTNTLCGQNVELVNVELVVYIVTSGL